MPDFVKTLANRIIRLFANLIKVLSYVFHFIFPNKRFIIPERAAPLLKGRTPQAIPRILWQTNFTNRVTLPLYANYLFNRLMSPTYCYRFMSTEARADFVQREYPADIHARYTRLAIGAAQADFWRVLVLNRFGGVYMDIDATLVWPLESTIQPGHQARYLLTKRGDISNYFVASRPDNPDLRQIIDVIAHNIDACDTRNIFEMTGPGAFNRVLDSGAAETAYYKQTCIQGVFTNEHFQYLDKKEGKWTRVQDGTDILR